MTSQDNDSVEQHREFIIVDNNSVESIHHEEDPNSPQSAQNSDNPVELFPHESPDIITTTRPSAPHTVPNTSSLKMRKAVVVNSADSSATDSDEEPLAKRFKRLDEDELNPEHQPLTKRLKKMTLKEPSKGKGRGPGKGKDIFKVVANENVAHQTFELALGEWDPTMERLTPEELAFYDERVQPFRNMEKRRRNGNIHCQDALERYNQYRIDWRLYKIRIPQDGEYPFERPGGDWVCISNIFFEYGFRLPMHDLYSGICEQLNICVSQFVPNAIAHISALIAKCT